MELSWKKFNALGTEVVVAAYLADYETYLLDRIQARLAEFEQRFSRFVKGNELDRLNNLVEGEHEVSPALYDIMKSCQEYYRLTGGIFDPAIIDSLEAIGYDRSFLEIKAGNSGQALAIDKLRQGEGLFFSRPKIDQVRFLPGNKIVLPKHFHIDLGGIGKGYVADLLANEVLAGIGNCWLSVGGDLVVKGRDGDKPGWKINVEHPEFDWQTSFSIETQGQKIGIATSGTNKRKGSTAGVNWHHLIDPRTGLPAETDIISVTAVADSAVAADVFAKTVLLLGVEPGLAFAERQPELEVVIYRQSAAPIFSSNFNKYL